MPIQRSHAVNNLQKLNEIMSRSDDIKFNIATGSFEEPHQGSESVSTGNWIHDDYEEMPDLPNRSSNEQKSLEIVGKKV